MHSNNYTLGFVFIVTLVLGTMLSFTKDSVKVLQDQNLKADVQKTILRSLNFDESSMDFMRIDQKQYHLSVPRGLLRGRRRVRVRGGVRIRGGDALWPSHTGSCR